MKYYDTLVPYAVIDYSGIQYSTCVDYKHVSRYRNLRTVIHNSDGIDRFVSLESPNTIKSNIPVKYYTVRNEEENRLDVIADKYLGSASYSWILSYINGIEDGYTVGEGQKIKIPASRSVVSLFDKNEMLASVNPLLLNLGEE